MQINSKVLGRFVSVRVDITGWITAEVVDYDTKANTVTVRVDLTRETYTLDASSTQIDWMEQENRKAAHHRKVKGLKKSGKLDSWAMNR